MRRSYWLNAQEAHYDLIVYIADRDLTDWSRISVHQADQVLIVATGDSARPPGTVEAFAFGVHPTSHRRLVRLHTRRRGAVEGTASWLAGRDVFMHHQVALEDDSDTESLYRFLTGKAIGFVAGGGGSYGSAHIGVFQAFEERGVKFDIVGGTSAGAAMMAGFAILGSAKVITNGIEDIFIKSRSLERLTLPKYALLDHVAFDAALVNIAATMLRTHGGTILRSRPIFREMPRLCIGWDRYGVPSAPRFHCPVHSRHSMSRDIC